MRILSIVAVVASGACGACGGSHGGPPTVVIAQAGAKPEPGATVISHTVEGVVVDQVTADATGRAELASSDLVTVVFPGLVSAITPNISLVTTPPLATGELVVSGPPHDGAPGVVGALQIMPARKLVADYYDVELGCATVRLTDLTQVIDVGARCLGSDTNLDVLVVGFAGTPAAMIGYAAGRVPMVNQLAAFAFAQWQTTGPTVPITLSGVAPALDWILWADGLPFDVRPLGATGQLWTGLAVDAATVHASLATPTGARETTLEISGAPTTIQLGAGDFLAAVAPSLVADPHLALHWTATDVGADAVDVHLEWDAVMAAAVVPPGSAHVAWDVVVAPDATRATFPSVGGDLETFVAPPPTIPTALVRYVDGPDVIGFAALTAAGIHVEDATGAATIAARPTSGELRTTYAIGVTP